MTAFVTKTACALSGAALMLALTGTATMAQTTAPAARVATVELTTNASNHTAGLQRGRGYNLRGNWALSQDTILNADLLTETKFGSSGGVTAVGVTQTINPDWYVAGTASWGRGGPNWIRNRVDGAVSRKWGANRNVVTTLGLYQSHTDGGVADRGLRVSVNYYMNNFVVFEGGASYNRTTPSGNKSYLPYFAVTLGQEGLQYLTLRASRGFEGVQNIGDGTTLGNYLTQTYSVDWRYWMSADWGVILRAERYLNPTYDRTTLGGGLFLQM